MGPFVLLIVCAAATCTPTANQQRVLTAVAAMKPFAVSATMPNPLRSCTMYLPSLAGVFLRSGYSAQCVTAASLKAKAAAK